MKTIDKAGINYWNENWKKVAFPRIFDENDFSLDNYVNLQLHRYFKELLKNRKNFSVLEIGCANSVWLAYFYHHFNSQVSGLDYSEIGCKKSRDLLEYYKIPANIYCSNLFSPPIELEAKFDLVVSFGVVEHFEDTAYCLKSCAAFVKPGGLLFTLIPNISGIIGHIQKFVDKDVYDVHVPITKKSLIQAHKNAGLKLRNCEHFMSINLSVINSGAFSAHWLNSHLRRALSGVSKFFWMLEKFNLKFPKNKFTSPYIISVAEI